MKNYGLDHVQMHFTRFTKRHFVRQKNTQRIHLDRMIQNFSLISNIQLFFRLRQRFMLYFNFHFSSRFFTYKFFYLLSNCRKFHWITQPRKCDIFVFIVLLTGRCGAKITQNEKLKYKIKRWMDFKMDTLFLLGMKNQII